MLGSRHYLLYIKEKNMDYIINYSLILLALFIATIAEIGVNSAYSKYKKVANSRRITGKEAARIILDKNGLYDVGVNITSGILSDHYDPRNKTVNLSNDIYNGTSIASISVACHECGHALQDKDGYTFMKIRSGLIPIVNFSSKLGYFAILIGFFLGLANLVWIGIFAEIAILAFQLVTLPVEFNASSRALQEIEKENLLNSEELTGGRKVLKAAAFTYVASVLSTLLEIFRLVIMLGNRDRD